MTADLSSVAREAAEARVERIREHVGFAPEDAAWFVYGYVPGFTECASRIPSQAEISAAIREAVRIGQVGPNSRDILEQGGTVALTSGEAWDAAKAVHSLIERSLAE